MHRKPLILAGATVAALLALPAIASAHKATIACDQQRPGQYVVTPDFLHLDPVTTFGPTTATVVWRDGFRVTLPLPAGCAVPPPPPPVVPPAPPVTPPVAPGPPEPMLAPPPPVVTPGQPIEPMPRKRVTPRKPVRITCAYLKAHRAGKWSYVARGFYPGCKAPKPPRKYIARVPVTG